VSNACLASEWEKFKGDYNKKYASVAEEAERKEIFIENLNKIREYQRIHPDRTFELAINHLADRRSEVSHLQTLTQKQKNLIFRLGICISVQS
jgi:hypothetical protein